MSTIPTKRPKSNSAAVIALLRALPDATTALEAAQTMVRSWPAYAQLTEKEQIELEGLVAARCGPRHLPDVTG